MESEDRGNGNNSRSKRPAEDAGSGDSSKRPRTQIDDQELEPVYCYGKVWENGRARQCKRSKKTAERKWRCKAKHKEWLSDDELFGLQSVSAQGRQEEGQSVDHAAASAHQSLQEDPCTYLQTQLAALVPQLRMSLEDMCRLKYDSSHRIAVVLIGINNLHNLANGEGFSIAINEGGRETIEGRGRTLLMSSNHNSEPVLYVVQYDNAGTINMGFLSPVCWKFGRKDRDVILESCWGTIRALNWCTAYSNSGKPNNGTWIDAPVSYEEDIGDTYIVLCAWALALGLAPNPSFVPKDRFRVEAEQMFRLALEGNRIDWVLVRAFLSCHQFILEENTDVPANRQFSHSLKNVSLSRYLNGNPESAITIPIANGRPHRDVFETDGWSDRERRVIIPKLKQSGHWEVNMSSQNMKNTYDNLFANTAPGRPTDLALDQRNYASGVFHEQFQRVTQRWRISESQPGSASTKAPTRTYLQQSDISCAIAAVALAFEALQENFLRFCCVGYDTLRSFTGQDTRALKASSLIFDGSPLIVPWFFQSHALLVVVQTLSGADGSEETAIYLLDSGPWIIAINERQHIIKAILALIGHPTSHNTNYVSVAVQHEAWQAGYYVICNAWSIMLGLELNYSFRPREMFFVVLHDLVRLSLEGNANWELIWAFLRSQDFVLHGVPGDERQFPKSISKDRLPLSLKDNENRKVTSPQPRTRENTQSRIRFLEERVHYKHAPWDNWSAQDRGRRAPQLLAEDLLDVNISDTQLQRRFGDLKSKPFEEPRLLDSTSDVIFDRMRGHLRERGYAYRLADRPTYNIFAQTRMPTQSFQFQLINRDPHGYFKGKMLSYFGLLEALQASPIQNSAQLTYEDIMLSIAAVVEAMTLNQDIPGGGFSVASSRTLHRARQVEMSGPSSISGPVARPRRPWLFPLTVAMRQPRSSEADSSSTTSHTVLILAQEEMTLDTTYFRRQVLDSSGIVDIDYDSLIDETDRIVVNLGWSTYRNEDEQISFKEFDPDQDIVSVALQKDNSASGIHAVLNAWICALGLTVNDDHPEGLDPSFYDEAGQLIHAANTGLTDWSTISAFLIHHQLIKERRVQDVPVSRRFPYTQVQTDDADLEVRLRPLILEDQMVEKLNRGVSNFPYNFSNNIALHEDVQSTDEPGDDDGLEDHMRSMKGFGYENPCDYLQDEIRYLENRGDVHDWLSGLNPDIQTTTKTSKSPSEEDILLAIASVTLAITENSPIEVGLSIVGLHELRACRNDVPLELRNAIRFGRPMVVPLAVGQDSYFVLLILQLDEKDEPSITIVNSEAWRLDSNDRESIYQAGCRIIQRSNWLRKVHFDPQMPENASWAAGIQLDDRISGFYTVFAAWALAMNTQLNTNFKPSERFLDQAIIMMQYARGGFLSWSIILAFLECYDFVIKGQEIAQSTKFKNTVRLDSGEALEDQLEILRQKEEAYWTSQENADYKNIGSWNNLSLPDGVPHNLRVRSDDWSGETRNNIVPSLISWGKFDPSHSQARLKGDYDGALQVDKIGITSSVNAFARQADALLAKVGPVGTDQHNTTLSGSKTESARRILSDLYGKHVDPSLLAPKQKKLEEARIENALGSYAKSRFEIAKKIKNRYSNLLGTLMEFPKLGNFLSDEEVALAIASVLEAINDEQPTYVQSGFTLVAPFQLSLARNPQSGAPGTVLRPRRCWMVPYVVAAEHYLAVRNKRSGHDINQDAPIWGSVSGLQPNGHIFLIVIQEEEFGETREFRTYFLDSSPGYLADMFDLFHTTAKSLATTLNWSTKFNNDSHVDFSNRFWIVQVPHQRNDWACGIHTTLNAWILALGLTPNDKADYRDSHIYVESLELFQIAVAGLLDWRTLVYWLFWHGLVVERSIDSVPEDRRFRHTILQSSTLAFEQRIGEDVQAEGFSDMKEGDIRYNTNVDFSKLRLRSSVAVESDEDNDDEDSLEEGQEEHHTRLQRGYEEFPALSSSDWYRQLFGKKKLKGNHVDIRNII